MARPNKQKIDHENLRDWLVCRPTEAGQVLKKIELPPKAKRYLYMEESEIVKDFREAKDKQMQIGILADRNLTTKVVIREVLREHGIDLPEPKNTNRGKARKSTEPMRETGGGASPLPIEQDIEGGGEPLPDVAATAAENCGETEGETMAEDAGQKTMTLRVLSKVLQCVNEAFPDTPAQFAAGSPSGALLTVHWGADGEITETALLIEGA